MALGEMGKTEMKRSIDAVMKKSLEALRGAPWEKAQLEASNQYSMSFCGYTKMQSWARQARK